MDGMTNADAVNCTKEAAIVAQLQSILLLKLHPCGCKGNRIQLERATM